MPRNWVEWRTEPLTVIVQSLVKIVAREEGRVAAQPFNRHGRAVIGRVIIDVGRLTLLGDMPFEAGADLLQPVAEIRDRPRETGRQIVDLMATAGGIQQLEYCD